MPDQIPTPEETRKATARQLMQKIHPDRITNSLKATSGDNLNHDDIITATKKLIPLLDWTLKRPDVPDNWGQDLNKQYPKDSIITLVGTGPDGTVRPPQNIALRKPADFLDILDTYLKTGDISEDLPPPYDPVKAPPILGIAAGDGGEDGDDDDGDTEAPRARAAASYEAHEAEHSLKTATRNATDYDFCVGLRVATRMYAQVTMRAHGVLQALDEKVEEFLTEEIKEADTSEKLQQAKEHIDTYDWDDKTVQTRLQEVLAEHTESLGVLYPPPNQYEIEASKIRTLDDLAKFIPAIEQGTFASPEEKSRTLRSVDGYARQLLIDECNRSATIDAFKDILEKTRQFHFISQEYGFRVLDSVEMRAKGFLLAQIFATKSPPTLDAMKTTLEDFHFPHRENTHELLQAINERKAQLPQLRGTKQV